MGAINPTFHRDTSEPVIPQVDVFNFLCSTCKSCSFDFKSKSLRFYYPDSTYFNGNVKKVFVARFNQPYLTYINMFDEVCLDISLTDLLRHQFRNNGAIVGNTRSFSNYLFSRIYEKSQKEK